MRAAALASLALLLGAGCVDASISVQVTLVNQTAIEQETLVKVWDEKGKLVLNRTVTAAPGQEQQVAILTALPPYRAEYTFLAHVGDMTHQEARMADGLTGWRIEVRNDGIGFAFQAED